MLSQVGVIHHQKICGINRRVLVEVDPIIHDRDLLSPLVCPDVHSGNSERRPSMRAAGMFSACASWYICRARVLLAESTAILLPFLRLASAMSSAISVFPAPVGSSIARSSVFSNAPYFSRRCFCAGRNALNFVDWKGGKKCRVIVDQSRS